MGGRGGRQDASSKEVLEAGALAEVGVRCNFCVVVAVVVVGIVLLDVVVG